MSLATVRVALATGFFLSNGDSLTVARGCYGHGGILWRVGFPSNADVLSNGTCGLSNGVFP